MWHPRRRIPKLFLCLNIVFCQSDSSTIPATFWEYQLKGSGSISGAIVRRENGLVASQDETSLWITMDDGSLHIITELFPKTITEKIYMPTSLTNRYIESRSNVQLYEHKGKVLYGVYAILDVGNTITSRILCINANGQLRWQVILDGIAMGTPQIGIDGKRIYITHNTGTDYLTGKLTMMENDMYGIRTEIPLQGAGGFGFADVAAPFGPIAVSIEQGNDAVYWGESWAKGTAGYGTLYKYKDGTVIGLRRMPWSTTVAPTLSKDGKSLWIQGGAGLWNAWTSGQSFSKHPSWSQNYTHFGRSTSSPTHSEVVISSNLERVYSILDSTTILCLNAISGIIVWEREGTAKTCSSLQLSENDEFLFVVHASQGLVQKFHAYNGRLLAEHSCVLSTSDISCRQSIQGRFSVSSDGSKLWFVDAFGKIATIEFSPDDATPTISPSSTPSSTPKPTENESKTLLPVKTFIDPALPTMKPSSARSAVPVPLTSILPSLGEAQTTPSSPAFSPSMVSNDDIHTLVTGLPTGAASETFNNSAQWNSSSAFQFTSTTSSTENPANTSGGWMIFTDVDLDALLAETDYTQPQETTAISNTNVYGTYSTYIAIAMLFLMVAMALGILIGRLWQTRRIRYMTLPSNIKVDSYQRYETIGSSVSGQRHQKTIQLYTQD